MGNKRCERHKLLQIAKINQKSVQITKNCDSVNSVICVKKSATKDLKGHKMLQSATEYYKAQQSATECYTPQIATNP
jgi:hypothetical protein